MPLNIKQVEHIAKLARLKLTAEEKKKFSQQLGDILDYFEKLKKVDTSKIEPTSQTIDLTNVDRNDEIKGCEHDVQKRILDNAPDKSGDYFKVNKIL